MKTKTLSFSDDVLSVISTMEWQDDGKLGKITQQLDRDLYVKVNKALETLGGKWSRKLQGHVFMVDPRPSVEGLLTSGTLIKELDGFFETPNAVIHKMFDWVNPFAGDTFLEPSAGLGAIVKMLPRCKHVTCVEQNQARCNVLNMLGNVTVVCQDFLEYPSTPWYDRIYMNPPFENGQDIDHVMHAYKFLRKGGKLVSVMSAGVLFKCDKKTTAFRDFLTHNYGDWMKLPEDAFVSSGTRVSTCLVYFYKED